MQTSSTDDTTARRQSEFGAPWSRLLQGVSVGATMLLLGVVVMVWVTVPSPAWTRWLILGSTLLILTGCLLFTVRAYRIEGRTLLVKRLFWWTRISLEGLREVMVDPEVMSRALRICGNGGLFSFSGWYWSKRSGRFRAYVTDHRRTVVLTLARGKIVLSPECPAAFVETLKARRQLRT
jgi:hypothetical protein